MTPDEARGIAESMEEDESQDIAAMEAAAAEPDSADSDPPVHIEDVPY